MTDIDYSKKYWQYADDVLNNKIIAGKLIKLACQRMFDFAKRDDIYFDYADVDKKIRFVQKLKHSDGRHAGKNFILLDYQQWVYANIFGWRKKSNNKRVTKNVLLLISRKSGKTFLGASLALTVAICDNQTSPEICFIANSAQQASIAFRHCSEQAKSIDPNEKIFKRFRHDIQVPINGARIKVLSSDTSKLDGLSPAMFLQDETGECMTFETWNILRTGQGAIDEPLGVSISSAGFHIGETYPLYNQWSYCSQILNGIVEDDTWFAAIYQIDEFDDWKDENVWIKANPSLGQTVSYDYMRDQIRSAIQTPANEVSIKTKNIDCWCQSQEVWIPRDYIQACMETVDLSDYTNEIMFGGIDLSTVNDLTAIAYCIPPNETREHNPDKFIFGAKIYIPEEALEVNANKEYYKEWIRRGYAIKTPGNVVDYNFILKDLLNLNKQIPFTDIAYDSYNATQFVINAENEGLPMAAYSQSLANFNKPSKFIQMLILSGKCIIDSNPVIDWMFSNCELMIDHNENIKPGKANGDRNAKIDAVIAIIQSLGCYLESTYFSPEAWVI